MSHMALCGAQPLTASASVSSSACLSTLVPTHLCLTYSTLHFTPSAAAPQPPELHPYNFPELLLLPVSPLREHNHQVRMEAVLSRCVGGGGAHACMLLLLLHAVTLTLGQGLLWLFIFFLFLLLLLFVYSTLVFAAYALTLRPAAIAAALLRATHSLTPHLPLLPPTPRPTTDASPRTPRNPYLLHHHQPLGTCYTCCCAASASSCAAAQLVQLLLPPTALLAAQQAAALSASCLPILLLLAHLPSLLAAGTHSSPCLLSPL